MVCFVALSLTKRRKGKDTKRRGIEKNGTPAHQKQKDKEEKRKKGKKTRLVEKVVVVLYKKKNKRTKRPKSY